MGDVKETNECQRSYRVNGVVAVATESWGCGWRDEIVPEEVETVRRL